MVALVLWILIGLLTLKIIWNFGVPYELLRRRLSKNEKERSGGISVMVTHEWLLLISAFALSFVADCKLWVCNPLNVLLWGSGAIVVSYIHCFVAGILCGRISTKIDRPKASSTKKSK